MSYPLQPYNPNNRAVIEQPINRPGFDGNNRIDELLGSFLGLANQLMGEILRGGPHMGGMSPFMGLDSMNPQMNIIGMSSMNVMQVARGPDGRPHVIQAINERRVGPNGVLQTRKALRDPDRGINKMQIGYFTDNHGEIVEHHLDSSTGQYRQDVRQQTMPPTGYNHPYQWQNQPQQQQQYALPAPSPYRYL